MPRRTFNTQLDGSAPRSSLELCPSRYTSYFSQHLMCLSPRYACRHWEQQSYLSTLGPWTAPNRIKWINSFLLDLPTNLWGSDWFPSIEVTEGSPQAESRGPRTRRGLSSEHCSPTTREAPTRLEWMNAILTSSDCSPLVSTTYSRHGLKPPART